MSQMKRLLSFLLAVIMVSFTAGINILATDNSVVYVTVENTTFSEGEWTGKLLDRFEVGITQGQTTMADVIREAFEENSITYSGLEENYITQIDGLSEFDAGGNGGWMVMLNDWFINAGISEFYVSDGDIITIRYTSSGFGADLGGTWENNEKTLNAVSFSQGELDEDFSPEKFEYTLLLPEETESVTVTPTATNKNFQTRNYLNTQILDGGNGKYIDGEEALENSICGLAPWEELPENINYYKRSQSIPVNDGDVILVACGFSYWNSMNNGEFGAGAENVDGCVYKFTVQKPQKEEITVDIGVYDYTAVTYKDENPDEIIAASENGIVFEINDFTVDSGTTAMEAFIRAFESEEKSYTLNEQYNYISEVGGLGEFDCGSESGWMYNVNDEFKMQGANDYVLSDGDSLKLHYSVKGWGTDIGSYFEGAPVIEKITLAGVAANVAENPLVTGEGSAQSPFVIPITVSADTDITSLIMNIESSLHENYLSIAQGDGLTNILQATNYENDVTFAIETLDGSLKSYYTVKVTKEQPTSGGEDSDDGVSDMPYVPSGGGGGSIPKKDEKSENFDIKDILKYVLNNSPQANVGSIGGEWAVLGLARSGEKISQEFYQRYYENVENYVKERSGVLHDKKYTEYSRVILALTAIGKNPADVAGYNLLLPLGDFEKTTRQGINGPIWALIALDSKNYEMPQNENAKVQATRNMYVEYILDAQKSDGGWSLLQSVISSDIDITAMAVQALSKYCSSKNVEEAVKKALIMLKNRKSSTCESAAQTLTALCELKNSFVDTEILQKAEKDVLSYQCDEGFMHMHGGAADPMATEQAFYSLVALKRFLNGEPSLYTMTDALKIAENSEGKEMVENLQAKTFDDIKDHKNRAEIEALAARGIINGKSERSFDPENTMTRAEFATIIVKALRLDAKSTAPFEDVAQSDWFYTYVNAAYENGIVNGVSEKHFNPYGAITRQEAAVMLSRSAKILKMNTQMELVAARDILAGFTDYVKTEQWAIIELAFCYDKGIIESEEMEISPKEAVKRCEIAQMVYNLLGKANMI